MIRKRADRAETLIDRLVAEAEPVRPLRPPLWRCLLWLLIAVIVIGGAVSSIGLRPDLAQQMARPAYRLEWLASLLAGVLSAIAAFHLGLPDRSPRWTLVPASALIVWMAVIGYGGLTDWIRRGSQGFVIGSSFPCFMSILTMSIPLSAAMLIMLRHAGHVRPVATIATGMFATTALAATGLTLYHPLDTSIMVLIWHGGTIALLVGLTTLASRRLFALAGVASPT
ncbi:NrsF family protein [Inquilinus sp. Marseille-Q2685]|uniref:NrsF family protein n=1 Tax=Inquilinus sp. Marseille-Q2685 TaxID=2866581 RepID=UPI001CE3CF2A|nr:DUF1109 domain-containing protein [Inquilinus sp. Marseille-Q2685]